ncbi:MAG: hypothetical protein WAV26_05330, partial [Candidatus Deferrimicrobium sp.]
KLLSYPLDFLMRRRSIVKFLLHEELIVYAITGERRAVVETLDALVKGYKPMYEFHGGPEASGNLMPDLSLPSPPSNSVH